MPVSRRHSLYVISLWRFRTFVINDKLILVQMFIMKAALFAASGSFCGWQTCIAALCLLSAESLAASIVDASQFTDACTFVLVHCRGQVHSKGYFCPAFSLSEHT